MILFTAIPVDGPCFVIVEMSVSRLGKESVTQGSSRTVERLFIVGVIPGLKT
jgi:hypothetical protein